MENVGRISQDQTGMLTLDHQKQVESKYQAAWTTQGQVVAAPQHDSQSDFGVPPAILCLMALSILTYMFV